jgi:phospholipid/cholesterol/gamma-HCH transport system substrate-binding protein
MSVLTSKLRRTAILAVSGLLLVMLGVVALRGESDADQGRRLSATVADAGSLEEGSEVRASGVLVGQVSSIELVGDEARIELEVHDGVLPVHKDATLTVRPVNLLGENYIDLDPGSADAPFLERAEIPAKQVQTAVTLQDVLNTFEAPTAASLAAVVTTLGEGLHNNGGEVSAALKALLPAMENSEELGKILARQNKVLANLVSSADPVAAALADEDGRTLDRLLTSTERALGAIEVQETALEQTLLELPSTLVSAQRTLARFGGVAAEATPTVRALRPLTGDLQTVVKELRAFADAADPALASLEPVLRRADQLLTQAAPVVAGLRKAGPDLRRSAASLRPVGRELLDENLYGVMEFVRKWALSTNSRDGLSHYFRGVIYVTPTTLNSLLTSLIPSHVISPNQPSPGDGQPTPDGPLPDVLPDGVLPDGVLPEDLSGLDGILGGLLGKGHTSADTPDRTSSPSDDRTSALGLTATQEQRLIGQLLGGQR